MKVNRKEDHDKLNAIACTMRVLRDNARKMIALQQDEIKLMDILCGQVDKIVEERKR